MVDLCSPVTSSHRVSSDQGDIRLCKESASCSAAELVEALKTWVRGSLLLGPSHEEAWAGLGNDFGMASPLVWVESHKH